MTAVKELELMCCVLPLVLKRNREDSRRLRRSVNAGQSKVHGIKPTHLEKPQAGSAGRDARRRRRYG